MHLISSLEPMFHPSIFLPLLVYLILNSRPAPSMSATSRRQLTHSLSLLHLFSVFLPSISQCFTLFPCSSLSLTPPSSSFWQPEPQTTFPLNSPLKYEMLLSSLFITKERRKGEWKRNEGEEKDENLGNSSVIHTRTLEQGHLSLSLSHTKKCPTESASFERQREEKMKWKRGKMEEKETHLFFNLSNFLLDFLGTRYFSSYFPSFLCSFPSFFFFLANLIFSDWF